MLGALSIVGFIPITNAERARKFYVETLGLPLVEDGPYAIAIRAGANVIRLVKMEEHKPSDFTILGWETNDIAATVRAMKSAGVKIETYDYLEHDDLGIWNSDDSTSKIAWFKDPDGNTLSVSQH
jgi:catechol 2,3-dioxygenase-like lactoylglutathione lyase family enzyme